MLVPSLLGEASARNSQTFDGGAFERAYFSNQFLSYNFFKTCPIQNIFFPGERSWQDLSFGTPSWAIRQKDTLQYLFS